MKGLQAFNNVNVYKKMYGQKMEIRMCNSPFPGMVNHWVVCHKWDTEKMLDTQKFCFK